MTNLLPVALAQRLFFVLLSSLFTLSAQTLWAEELVAPEFSHESGFYPEEFELVISHPDPEAKIYYTLDGSDPDPENLKGTTFRYKNEYAQPPSTEPIGEFLTQEYKTHLYEKPILIKDRTSEPNRLANISTTFDEIPDYFPKKAVNTWCNKAKLALNKTINGINKAINKLARHFNKYILKKDSVAIGKYKYIKTFEVDYLEKTLYKGIAVKAIAVNKSNAISKIVNKTLFIGKRSEFRLPIINITVPEKELFDYENGIFVAGLDYDEWIQKNINNKKTNGSTPANWNRKSIHTKKITTHITFINNSNSHDIETKIRVHGGASRIKRNKSIRLYLNKKELNNAQIKIFKDDFIRDYRVNLRNAGNRAYSNYMQDAIIHKIARGLEIGTQRYAPKIIFINSEYYGILNARDRKDAQYIKYKFNLPDKNLDLLKGKNTVDHGSNEQYSKLLKKLEKTNPSSKFFYNWISSEIDLDSFIDYFSLSIYYARTDWPGNNIAFWRYAGDIDNSNKYTDGKWRWLLYDADESFSAEHPTLLYALNMHHEPRKYSSWVSQPLATLIENPQFKLKFITRFSDLINSWFLPERAISITNMLEKALEKEMPRHIARWNRPKNMEEWRKQVSLIKNIIPKRPAYQWQHLQEFFELDGLYSVQIDITQQGTGKVKLNTLTLGDNPDQEYNVTDTPLFFPWRGQYFQNLPLTLEAMPEEGYTFSHWDVSGLQLTAEQKRRSKLILKPQNNFKIKAVMVKAPTQ